MGVSYGVEGAGGGEEELPAAVVVERRGLCHHGPGGPGRLPGSSPVPISLSHRRSAIRCTLLSLAQQPLGGLMRD